MPDVLDRVNEPGKAATESVLAAVEAVAAAGLVDRQRVAVVGREWGGYQAVFTATQSAAFSAVAVAAPMSDLVSISGSASADIGRHFAAGFLEDPLPWATNSPLTHAGGVTAPVLIVHSERRDGYPLSQSVALFNALRTSGKQVVLLEYASGSATAAAQGLDSARRLLEFLDHFLKSADAPSWWSSGR
jgi:dipeptidyl aminopeptidase/acylaminoacyl peptidase